MSLENSAFLRTKKNVILKKDISFSLTFRGATGHFSSLPGICFCCLHCQTFLLGVNPHLLLKPDDVREKNSY